MIELPICDLGNSLDKHWNTAVKLLGPSDKLPIPDRIENLYLDFETTSGNPKLKSLNPHKNCKILGAAVLFDSEPYPYYVPIRHHYLENGEYKPRPDIPNIAAEKVYDWLREILKRTKTWINQNIKYDIHVLLNEAGIFPKCNLLDTLTLAKLSEFQEQLDYSLDRTMKLFGIDITYYEGAIKECLGKGIQDYGLIPPDRMAIYAGVDVLSCRHIHHNIKIPQECQQVLELENKILTELIRMEQIGVRVEHDLLLSDYHKLLPVQEKRIRRIQKFADFPKFDPSKRADQHELFVERMGWDIPLTDKSQERAEEGETEGLAHSFSYENVYRHAHKNPRVAVNWLKYVDDQKLLNTYIIPYLTQHSDQLDLIHAQFNQIKRTGRMSCTFPNMTALNKKAKRYIIPYTDDYVLVEFDLSQIEFRVIVHYIQNQKCIQDFNNNPKTDFHSWVAQMCGIDRYPAKRINFMLGYGGGREKTVSLLANEPKIIGSLKTFAEINARALEVYEKYHAALPELKPTQWRASQVLRSRGYVRTLYNRHRNIPKLFHFKAFNSVCQGSAADILKLLTLRLRPLIGPDCLLQLLVHDCWLFSIRKERVNELIPLIQAELERPLPEIGLSVPILTDHKISDQNWSKCA